MLQRKIRRGRGQEGWGGSERGTEWLLCFYGVTRDSLADKVRFNLKLKKVKGQPRRYLGDVSG